MNDQLFVKSVTTSKSFDWLKWLEAEELVEFFAELFKLLTQISEGKKDAETVSIFLSEWRETALINSEPDVLDDIVEAQQELAAGGGKRSGHRLSWTVSSTTHTCTTSNKGGTD